MNADFQRYKRERAKVVAMLRRFLDEEHGYGPQIFAHRRTDTGVADDSLPDKEAINAAVVTLVALLDLGGGSGGDRDLYSLLYSYLWDPALRAAVNELMRERGGCSCLASVSISH